MYYQFIGLILLCLIISAMGYLCFLVVGRNVRSYNFRSYIDRKVSEIVNDKNGWGIPVGSDDDEVYRALRKQLKGYGKIKLYRNEQGQIFYNKS